MDWSYSGNSVEVMGEVQALRDDVRRLTDVVEGLRAQVSERAPLVLRDIPRNEAELEVADYLRGEGRAYPSDISNALKLDYDLVVELISKLEQEGYVQLEALGEGPHA